MRKWITVTVLAMQVLSPTIGNAAPERLGTVLTLAQAVQRIQQVSFDVRVAQGDAVVAAADAQTARAMLRPQIGVSGTALDANEPQLGMPIARQAYGSASLTLPLFIPANSARSSAITAGAAKTSIEATVSDAVLATVQAYRRLQLAGDILAARQVAVQDQKDHLRLTQLRVDAGKAARYLLARDRAAVDLALQNAEDAAAERDQAQNDLAAMLDLGLDTSLTTEPLTQEVYAEPRDALLARALQRRPALAAADERVAAAQAAIHAARGAYLPSAQISAESYNGGSSPYLGGSGGQVRFVASIPIVDGGSRAAAVARAQGDLTRATALRDQLRANVQRDVADAYRELEAARRNLTTAQTAQTDAEEELRVARVRESAGKGIELEVLDALSVSATARETVVRSLTRYDIAVAAVRHAAGDSNS